MSRSALCRRQVALNRITSETFLLKSWKVPGRLAAQHAEEDINWGRCSVWIEEHLCRLTAATNWKNRGRGSAAGTSPAHALPIVIMYKTRSKVCFCLCTLLAFEYVWALHYTVLHYLQRGNGLVKINWTPSCAPLWSTCAANITSKLANAVGHARRFPALHFKPVDKIVLLVCYKNSFFPQKP